MASKSRNRSGLKMLFKRRRAVQIEDLFVALQTRSRMTIFRHLQPLNYLSSYSHAGRYYTLHELARFDRHGLWFYGDIGFSQRGSLKNTIVTIVNNCDAGKFHSELQKQLRVRVHNALLDLTTAAKIMRICFEGSYLYLSQDPGRSKRQTAKRRELTTAGLVPVVSDQLVIEVLVEVIRQADKVPDVHKVAAKLGQRGLQLTVPQVQEIFGRYGIEKKTSDFS